MKKLVIMVVLSGMVLGHQWNFSYPKCSLKPHLIGGCNPGLLGPDLTGLIKNENIEAVKKIIGNGMLRINMRNGFYRCILHTAAQKGNAEIVRLLIAAGVDINEKCNLYGLEGLRPNHCAKTVEIARILKEAGANVFATRDTTD